MAGKSLRVCVVGAGAVGLVYTLYLHRGGARVSLLVKPEQADRCRKGWSLHHLRAGGRRHTEFVPELPILSEVDAAATGEFDQIWITVASDALRAPWLGQLLSASHRATVVLVQPDLDDRGLVLAHVPERRLVQGLIGFLSFQSPLPGTPDLPAGIAYSLLPFGASTFDGAEAGAVVSALRHGGFSARRGSDLVGRSAERSATSVPIVAGLEAAGWSLSAFSRGPWLGRSLSASREALATVAVTLDRPPAAIARVLHPLAVRLGLAAGRRLSPFDLEAYLRFHFTKVGAQTRLMLETYRAHAQAAGLPSEALQQLREAL